jgi:PAS domain S-box-containing protein
LAVSTGGQHPDITHSAHAGRVDLSADSERGRGITIASEENGTDAMTSTGGRRTSEAAAEEKRALEAAVLLEIAQAAGSTLELAEVLDRVVEKTASLTGADRCSIWLLDAQLGRLVPAALFGMDPVFTARWKRGILAVRDERLSQEVIATGHPVVVLDAETDPRTDKRAVALFADKSFLVVPLFSKGRVIGTLYINHITHHYAFSEQDVAITMAIASQAAVAIENAKLYEESRRANDELLESFRRIGEALAAGLDLNETLQLIVNLATEIVQADIGVLELVGDDGRLTVNATRGVELARHRDLVAIAGDSLGESIRRSGIPARTADLREHALTHPTESLGSSLRSYLGVPLRLRGDVIGVLAVYDTISGRFTPSEVETLGSFANQAAIAIDNGHLVAALQRQVKELSVAMSENAELYSSLQAEKDRIDAIFRSSSDSVYMVDESLRLLAFNPAAEQMTGWTASEAIGAHCYDVFQCSHRPEPGARRACPVDCPMLVVMATKKAAPYVEMTIQTRDGQSRDVAAAYSLIPASQDIGPCGVGIVRDISRIKEVDRLKSDFISMVSHELRTPLAVIKGYAATLLNPNLNLDRDREKRFVKGINDASDRLTRLIDNLLSVSRLDSGRFKVNPQWFDLNEIVQRVSGSFRLNAGKHQLIVRVPDAGIRLRADRDQIDQVLTNLVSNAIKYSPDGGDIQIAARQVSDGELGPRVEITVADQGIGIPRSQQYRVFEKFYRGDAAVSRRVSGTGLGLYICKSIVEAHGGHIWVESELGEGSVFHFSLPASVPGRPESQLPSDALLPTLTPP